MICTSIALESRRMALADMLTAARQCDLLEVRLDRFAKAPIVGELLSHKRKPTILSCRRRQDGGDWDGSEDDRLALLRQCVVSKADYVEIELDVADRIRPLPPPSGSSPIPTSGKRLRTSPASTPKPGRSTPT